MAVGLVSAWYGSFQFVVCCTWQCWFGGVDCCNGWFGKCQIQLQYVWWCVGLVALVWHLPVWCLPVWQLLGVDVLVGGVEFGGGWFGSVGFGQFGCQILLLQVL